MDSENDLHHQDTVQLIDNMMSFLDDVDEPVEESRSEESDKLENPLCSAIKGIIFPADASLKQQQMHANEIEKNCRSKDPYIQEVSRLMFCSTMGHPPNGTPEYFQVAENYALFGKEFLDFPTDMKFPQPLDVGFVGGISSTSSGFSKQQPSPVFGMQLNKCTKQLTTAPQQQILVNQTNYCSYPFLQPQSLVQPCFYANPFLMTQYLNAFVKETQVNTSLVQQQQFLTGGIHERMVYAHMLQQQIQTNQAALMGSYFVGSGFVGAAKCKNEIVKVAPTCGKDNSIGPQKTDLDSGGMEENPRVEL